MRIFVTAKPNSKIEGVKEIDALHFVVSVKEPPVQGRANKAILKILGKHLGVSPSKLRIIRGFASRQKVIEM